MTFGPKILRVLIGIIGDHGKGNNDKDDNDKGIYRPPLSKTHCRIFFRYPISNILLAGKKRTLHHILFTSCDLHSFSLTKISSTKECGN